MRRMVRRRTRALCPKAPRPRLRSSRSLPRPGPLDGAAPPPQTTSAAPAARRPARAGRAHIGGYLRRVRACGAGQDAALEPWPPAPQDHALTRPAARRPAPEHPGQVEACAAGATKMAVNARSVRVRARARGAARARAWAPAPACLPPSRARSSCPLSRAAGAWRPAATPPAPRAESVIRCAAARGWVAWALGGPFPGP